MGKNRKSLRSAVRNALKSFANVAAGRVATVLLALSHRCDLLVAVAQGEGAGADLQRIIVAFLASEEMHHWMMASLGGH